MPFYVRNVIGFTFRPNKTEMTKQNNGPTSFGSCGCVRRRHTCDKSPGTVTASRPTLPGREAAVYR